MEPVSICCAARCASCFSWIYNQISNLCGSGSTITITCRQVLNNLDCFNECKCCQKTEIHIGGNLTQYRNDDHRITTGEEESENISEQKRVSTDQKIQQVKSEHIPDSDTKLSFVTPIRSQPKPISNLNVQISDV